MMAALNPAELPLRPAGGAELNGNCPFCGDTKRHLYVNAEKGVYQCFRCGAAGTLAGGPSTWSRREPAWAMPEESVRANPETLDRVYRELLRVLALSDAHRQHLTDVRKMSVERIARGGYRTLPQRGRVEIAERVARRADPSGVPGFYRLGSRWCLAGPPGILIPARDFAGRILGVQIRRDNPGTGPRYVWLSSKSSPRRDRPAGTPAKTAFHVARPPGSSLKRVWITEGPLKADISAYVLGETVVAVPGVNVWRGTGLIPTLKSAGVREVVVAFDADAEVNGRVAQAEERLASALEEAGFEVLSASWPLARGKGLDDLLLAGGRPAVAKRRGPAQDEGGRNVNRSFLTGRLAGPPVYELIQKRDQTSVPRVRLTLIVDRPGSEYKDTIPVLGWGKVADRVAGMNLAKGQMVMVEGELRTGTEYLAGQPYQVIHVNLLNLEAVA